MPKVHRHARYTPNRKPLPGIPAKASVRKDKTVQLPAEQSRYGRGVRYAGRGYGSPEPGVLQAEEDSRIRCLIWSVFGCRRPMSSKAIIPNQVYPGAYVFRGLCAEIGDVDRFRSTNGVMVGIRNAKQKIAHEFSDGGQGFRQQLVQIGQWGKARMDIVERNGERAGEELVRLADGKGLMIKLRRLWKFTPANEGLLVQRVCQSDFASKFRERLIAVTGA